MSPFSAVVPERVDVGAAFGLRGPTGVVGTCFAIPATTAGTDRLVNVLSGGSVVLSGAVLRSVRIGRRTSALLLGPGDLVPQQAAEPPPFHAWSRALVPSTIAVLDADAMLVAASVPAVAVSLLSAMAAQADQLGLETLLGQLTSIAERLGTLLPVLADRWGTVAADGVFLPAFFSHGVLADLIGVRRPSLTTALSELDRAGTLRRLDDRRWLLSPQAAGLAA